MNSPIPSTELIKEIEYSEIAYMTDRMTAIQNRPGNPEGIEIRRFGNAVAFYSKTMPWSSFNTVKGLTNQDADRLEEILDFYKSRARNVHLEVVPSRVDKTFLKRMAELDLYSSGFHCSLITEPKTATNASDGIRIQELNEDQFDLYATIHCRGTGLSDDGIPHVARNNKVLYGRPGWKFYLAFLNDSPAAVGVMHIRNRTASLTFAATLPEFRNQGLHRQLLNRRIADALHNDCKLVVAQCSFLSPSHRNMEHAGMKLGYLRTSWTEK
ncbi:GNAT family N-acetyltransferase [Cohnella thailandensis]|uniref:GNAT family N-acetyltransferase n=1 Tax=Cohnella thailandensis TaxID=557557 RepID=A0A841SV50_9BACL|nr:GNAT family N-acetyltransferase [Cohnella thailandensis]MBB6634476.1 GNAT family N-acetyltransferase [Cohnella thailandensis]MBP1972970.1 GNAT superfamily N-acetyltransferase [Cohnella thailandensis]